MAPDEEIAPPSPESPPPPTPTAVKISKIAKVRELTFNLDDVEVDEVERAMDEDHL